MDKYRVLRTYDSMIEHMRSLAYHYKCDRIEQEEQPGLGNYQSDATSYDIEALIRDFEELEPEMAQQVHSEVDAYGCSKAIPKLVKKLEQKKSGYELYLTENKHVLAQKENRTND